MGSAEITKIMKMGVLCLVLLLFSSFVNAAIEGSIPNFDYKITPVTDSIFIYETAEYELEITNKQELDDRFQISSLGSRFVVIDKPALDSMEVGKDGLASSRLLIDPKNTVGEGPFGVPVKIKSLKSGQFVELQVPLNIKPLDPDAGSYPCSVALGVDINKQVDPREKVIVNILLRNRNALDIPELTVHIDGEIFSETYTSSLGPLEEKGNEVIFSLDPLTQQGQHNLKVEVDCNTRKSSSEKSYEIIGYAPIEELVQENKELFKSSFTYTFSNNGNTNSFVNKQFPVNFFQRIFTTTEPEAEVVREFGQTNYVWQIPIESQGTKEIYIVTNYRLLALIILLIILGVIAYYVFRSPVIIGKDALFSKTDSHGASELKIKVFIRNRTRNPIHNLRIIDRIPGVGELTRTKELGTVHPDKVVKDPKKGTIVRWNIDALEPYEERIITYTIKSKLKIIGSVRLPSVKAKFDTRRGERVTESGPITVSKKKK